FARAQTANRLLRNPPPSPARVAFSLRVNAALRDRRRYPATLSTDLCCPCHPELLFADTQNQRPSRADERIPSSAGQSHRAGWPSTSFARPGERTSASLLLQSQPPALAPAASPVQDSPS